MRSHLVVAGLLTPTLLGACSGGGSQVREPTPVNTGLNALRSGETPAFPNPVEPRPHALSERAWEQAALDLQTVLDESAEDAGVLDEPAAPIEPPVNSLPEIAPPAAEDAPIQAILASPEPPSPLLGVMEESLDDRVDRLALELTEALKARAHAGEAGLPDALRLAFLECIAPGALGEGAELDEALIKHLAPSEVAHLEAARDLTRAWLAASIAGSTDDTIDALGRASESLTKADPSLRISDAQICQRVDGYGAYIPFESNAFLAGQPNHMIVYTELERFSHRSVSAGDHASADETLAVEVSQELTLFHEPSDNLQAWHQPRATIVTTSRRPRREFFLVNQITLPANLSVGAYRLRIVTRDEVSGAAAEATIPIRIVADARLVVGSAP